MTKKQSLVEQARAIPNKVGKTPSQYSKEEIDLCVEWALDRVALRQVGILMSHSNTAATYTWLLFGLRQLVQREAKK